MKRFRALIFDVDGTLAETEEVHRRAFNDAFAYFELPWFWDSGLYRKLLRVSGGKERIRHFIDHHSTGGTLLSVEQIASCTASRMPGISSWSAMVAAVFGRVSPTCLRMRLREGNCLQ